MQGWLVFDCIYLRLIKIIYSNSYPQVNLKHLYASNNQLSSLDNIFRNNIYLEVVDFEYNQLVSLSDKLFRYSNLVKEINFSWNKLTSLDGKMFGLGLRNLVRVSIRIRVFIQKKKQL